MGMLEKNFKFQIKDLTEAGEFTGFASIFGNVDLQGDIVEKGAFARTLQHKGGRVPLLWQHKTDEPIGYVDVEEDDRGLRVTSGKLLINEVVRSKEAYALMKAGVLKGMSIGYDVVKEAWEKSNRILKELKLWEVSLVTFPANPSAGVTGVKSELCFKADTFKEVIEKAKIESELWDIRWKIQDALSASVGSIVDDKELDTQSKLSMLSTSIDQWKEAFMGWCIRAMSVSPNTITKGFEPDEKKEGRILSGANTTLVQQCIDVLQALLAAAKKVDSGDPNSPDSKSKDPASDLSDSEYRSLESMLQDMKNFTQRRVN
jgi:HK97 family phage prohead protease